MANWKAKAAAQRALALLPHSSALYLFVQRHITRTLTLASGKFESRLEAARKHADRIARTARDAHGLAVLELGTGRFPIVPLYLYLRGVGRVVTVDIAPLLSDGATRETFRRLADWLISGRMPEVNPERARELVEISRISSASWQDVLLHFGIEAVVKDIRKSGLPCNTFDVVVSNNTLEHIPPDVLAGILEELRRVAKPGTIMSHLIDINDHYADYDQSINVFNYLRYSKRTWNWFNNPLLYQNRLRVSDYRALHQGAGWQVIFEEDEKGPIEDLRNLPVARDFQHYAEEDLAVCRAWIVSRIAGRDGTNACGDPRLNKC